MISLNSLKILAGPVSGVSIALIMYSFTGNRQVSEMGGIAVWIAVWWITESVNIYLTSLLPLSLFPLFGIMEMKEVAPLYTNDIIFLFIGGFLIAFAIEKWNLHKRISLKILLMVGTSPASILLGIMLSSYLLSMWISNIATTMMLLPAVLAVIRQLEESRPGSSDKAAAALLLGLAHGATIGGTATIVGTAPNMIFVKFYNDAFPGNVPVNFTNWLIFALPVSVIFLAICYFVLKKLFIDRPGSDPAVNEGLSREKCLREYEQLGKIAYEEKIVFSLFIATVLLWFFRENVIIGSLKIPGWSNLFSFPGYISDSTVAMAVASVMFLIPSRGKGAILSWEEAKKIPVGIIFLFGGGFALAKGITVSGLSGWLAGSLAVTGNLDTVYIVIIVSVFTVVLSEFASNTATAYLILPIILAISKNVDAHPLLLMLPVVFSASYAFMLPVATPPNTVIFGTELIKAKSMMKAGIILNIIGISLMTLAVFTLGKWVFSF